MLVPAPNKLSGGLTKFLQRHGMLLHQHSDSAKSNHILKRIDSAKGNVAIFTGILRRKKAKPIPPPKLPFGQPGKPFNVFFTKGLNYGHNLLICGQIRPRPL